MKWNYETNLPVEGSYKRIGHNPVRVKEILKEYEEMAGTKEMMPWIESVNYDPDEFLLQKLYKNIPDVVPAQFITLLAFQFDAKPFLRDYFLDIANGYVTNVVGADFPMMTMTKKMTTMMIDKLVDID